MGFFSKSKTPEQLEQDQPRRQSVRDLQARAYERYLNEGNKHEPKEHRFEKARAERRGSAGVVMRT